MTRVPELLRSASGGTDPAVAPAAVHPLPRACAPDGERPDRGARPLRLFWVDIREPALPLLDPATRDGGARAAPATGLYHIGFDTGTPTPFAPAP